MFDVSCPLRMGLSLCWRDTEAEKTHLEEHTKAVMKLAQTMPLQNMCGAQVTRSCGMRQQVLTMMETGSEGGSRKHCTLEAPMP